MSNVTVFISAARQRSGEPNRITSGKAYLMNDKTAPYGHVS